MPSSVCSSSSYTGSLTPSTTLTTVESHPSTSTYEHSRLVLTPTPDPFVYRAQVEDLHERPQTLLEKYAISLRSRMSQQLDQMETLDHRRSDYDRNPNSVQHITKPRISGSRSPESERQRGRPALVTSLNSPVRELRALPTTYGQYPSVVDSHPLVSVHPTSSKPRVRTPSRPLSSNTSGSTSTVTPATRSKQTAKTVPLSVPEAENCRPPNPSSGPARAPPSDSATPSGTRKRFAIFGISLPSPRQNKFARSCSRGQSTEPSSGGPRPNVSEPSHSPNPSTTPQNGSRGRKAGRLARFLFGSPPEKDDVDAGAAFVLEISGPKSKRSSVASKRASMPTERYQDRPPSHLQRPRSQSPAATGRGSRAVFATAVTIPVIKHTPATPVRSKVSNPSLRPLPSLNTPHHPSGIHRKIQDVRSASPSSFASADDGGRSITSRSNQSHSRSPSRSRGRYTLFLREKHHEIRESKSRVDVSTQAARHSLDHSQPSISSVTHPEHHRIHRSGSGGGSHSRSGQTRRAAHGNFEFERFPAKTEQQGRIPSTPGGSTTGASERIDEEDEDASCHSPPLEGRGTSTPFQPTIRRDTNLPGPTKSHTVPFVSKHRSGPVSQHPNHAKSKSTGDAGPIVNGATNVPGSTVDQHESSSVGRAVGRRLRSAHLALPLFSFEPAVPAPSSTPPNEFGVLSSKTQSGSDPAVRAEKRRSYDGSGRRGGRTLELGLGLLWAPTKMKEEALLGASKRDSGGTRTPLGVLELREAERRLGKGKEKGRKPSVEEVVEVFHQVLDEKGFISFKKYIRRFDSEVISLEGPSGLLVRVKKLLDSTSSHLDEQTKAELLEDFLSALRNS